MYKYLVRYEYIVKGEVTVEARNAKEAMADYYQSTDYGEAETVVKSRATRAIKLKK